MCTDCKISIPLTQFSKRKASSDGLAYVCKLCTKSYKAHHREANRSKINAVDRARHWRDREKRVALSQKWRRTNIEYAHQRESEYRLAHRQKIRRGHSVRYALNELYRETCKRRSQKWAKDNHERVTERVKIWQKAHPEARRIQSQRRRCRKINAPGSHTQQQWLALCAKHNNLCLRCGQRKPLTQDHIQPLSRGGSNYIENIQPLCMNCNQVKFTKTIDYRL